MSSLRLISIALALAVLAAACRFVPDARKPTPSEAVPPAAAPAAPGNARSAEPASAPAKAGASAPDAAAPAPAAPPPPPAPPARATADFERAVGLMRAGNATEAELEFKQIALAYPQFAGPEVNLGIMYRNSGRLEDSQKALQAAVERNAASAAAWNELGITLRLAGKFQDALAAYDKALAIDPNLAAAHRNAGVLLDLYLDDSVRALSEFERYKELSGEEKPVSGWIAELKQRVAKATAGAAKPVEKS
jgi:tetratricopeptide (TPR) repeat protein